MLHKDFEAFIQYIHDGRLFDFLTLTLTKHITNTPFNEVIKLTKAYHRSLFVTYFFDDKMILKQNFME